MVMGQSKDERVMSLLDSFLEGKGENSGDVAELGSVPSDYVSAYLDTPSTVRESAADKIIRSKTERLLDAFLSSEYRKPEFATAKDDMQDSFSGDDSDDTEPLDDSYFTETLAYIYLKQRRYDKALEIIRSLYLNFPNKSIYFADQIRYLEKIVWINQNQK